MRSSELCNFEMSTSHEGEKKILEVIKKELRREFRQNTLAVIELFFIKFGREIITNEGKEGQ